MNPMVSRRTFVRAASAAGVLGLAGQSVSGKNSPWLVAGAARRKVTPPLSIPYLKSSIGGRNIPFEAFHDDLFARALVLDDGEKRIGLLAVDSIGYDNALLGPRRNFTAELRSRVAKRTNIPAQAIMLSATHAHSTPETIGLTPFREVSGVTEWLEEHLAALVDTLVEAWEKCEPVAMRYGSREVTGLTRNRRIMLNNGKMNRHGPVPTVGLLGKPVYNDEELAVLYLETLRGRPHSVLLNYTAHPVITMLLPQISADFPGATSTFIERQFPGAICLFTNGAAGNINTLKVSTSHDDATAVGKILADAAALEIEEQKKTSALYAPAVKVLSETKELAARRLSSSLGYGTGYDVKRFEAKLAEGPIIAEVQAMQVGPVRWTSFPGEAFVETGLAVKKNGANFVVGYANGWVGYLPTHWAYDDGDYECGPGPWSRVNSGSAEVLEEIAIQLLARFAA